METYRVCLADTAAGGAVYHARYFEMAERSRNAALRRVRLPGAAPPRRGRGDGGVGLVVHRGVARFAAPAFADDVLALRTDILKHNPARSWWRTTITRNEALICALEVELVCVDVTTGEPRLMPSRLTDAIGRVARREMTACWSPRQGEA